MAINRNRLSPVAIVAILLMQSALLNIDPAGHPFWGIPDVSGQDKTSKQKTRGF